MRFTCHQLSPCRHLGIFPGKEEGENTSWEAVGALAEEIGEDAAVLGKFFAENGFIRRRTKNSREVLIERYRAGDGINDGRGDSAVTDGDGW